MWANPASGGGWSSTFRGFVFGTFPDAASRCSPSGFAEIQVMAGMIAGHRSNKRTGNLRSWLGLLIGFLMSVMFSSIFRIMARELTPRMHPFSGYVDPTFNYFVPSLTVNDRGCGFAGTMPSVAYSQSACEDCPAGLQDKLAFPSHGHLGVGRGRVCDFLIAESVAPIFEQAFAN